VIKEVIEEITNVQIMPTKEEGMKINIQENK
jgi:hypothetical protein